MTADPAELGAYLQSRRAVRRPRDAGLPDHGRRRTPGLRREELAALAGVSIDYLTRLEQGRHREPSPSVLAALAGALDLDPAGRRHLFGLAGRPDPGPVSTVTTEVPQALRRLVDRALPSAAWVVNRRRDILVWNRAADALWGDLSALPADERNQLRLTFCSPRARSTWTEWEVVARDAVAQLRDIVARAADDPHVTSLVARLSGDSPEFAALWTRRDVARACSPRREVTHPVAGELTFQVELLDAAGGDLQLVLLEPADENSSTRWSAHLAATPGAGLRLA